jgi:hypothetical protein
VHLIQILLPRNDPNGARFDDRLFAQIRAELVKQFGGVTAYLRSPATGAWVAPGGSVERDEVVMVEVLTDDLDRGWWHDYLETLEARFGQEEILARSLLVEKL